MLGFGKKKEAEPPKKDPIFSFSIGRGKKPQEVENKKKKKDVKVRPERSK